MSYDFQIICSISIPPRKRRILFSFKLEFFIINKQNRYQEKKPKHSKEKKYFVKFNDSWCNKFKFIQKAAKGEGSVLYMEEKMISIDTPQSIGYMWMLHNKK